MFNWWFQKLGGSEPTPGGLALNFEFVRSKKGSFYEENVTKVIQKETKLVPKRAKVSPNDAQEQKYRFLVDFDRILDTVSAQLSIKNPIK